MEFKFSIPKKTYKSLGEMGMCRNGIFYSFLCHFVLSFSLCNVIAQTENREEGESC